MGKHIILVGNSQRDERLLAETRLLEETLGNSWGLDDEDEAELRDILQAPRVIKAPRRIAKFHMGVRVLHALKLLRHIGRVFFASSAEAASRHRQEDDAGGDDPDPYAYRWAALRAAHVARIRKLTGTKFSITEKKYWLRLLLGGWGA